MGTTNRLAPSIWNAMMGYLLVYQAGLVAYVLMGRWDWVLATLLASQAAAAAVTLFPIFIPHKPSSAEACLAIFAIAGMSVAQYWTASLSLFSVLVALSTIHMSFYALGVLARAPWYLPGEEAEEVDEIIIITPSPMLIPARPDLESFYSPVSAHSISASFSFSPSLVVRSTPPPSAYPYPLEGKSKNIN